jgi:hypothetical protein
VFERFTDEARRVVVLAQEEARLLDHNYIGTEHILLGLIHEGEGVAARVLESLDISLTGIRAEVEEVVGRGSKTPKGHIPFTPRAKKVLELSLREALQLGHNYIGTEHILLGLIREGEGVAAQVLVNVGADLSSVRQRVIQSLSGLAGSTRDDRSEPHSAVVQAQSMHAQVFAARSIPTCSFCGRDLWDVDHYVEGQGACICDVCIAAAHIALDDARDDEQVLRLPPRIFGLPPGEDPHALEEIIEALSAVFGPELLTEQSARYLEDGEQLVPIMIATRERTNTRASELIIRRVRFSTPSTATVSFEVILDNGGRFSFLGTMMRADDRWLVTRDTVADVLKHAGVSVPPPSTTPA